MTLRDDVSRLEQELRYKKEELSRKESVCEHNNKFKTSCWSSPEYDPEPYKEFIFTHYEGGGSDPIPQGYYADKKKDRWSRTCRLCGKKEYTYEQTPVKYEPKFR